VRALCKQSETLLPLFEERHAARFSPLQPLEQVAWDYRGSAHSTRAHPLALSRAVLSRHGLPDARSLGELAQGRSIRYAGLVICRQRPGTASEVTFMTLEDETGFANVVLWKRVFDAHALIARTCSFLGVTGKVQKEDGVVHIIAESLWQPQLGEDPAPTRSRDFH
jgi:error-prone DNA polymerase